MPRNLDLRVEAVAPIEEPSLRAQLEGLLERYLTDNRGALDMQTDWTFIQRHPDGEERNSQLQLMDDWKGSALIQPNR